MKKRIAIILVLVLLSSFLFSCDSSSEKESATTEQTSSEAANPDEETPSDDPGEQSTEIKEPVILDIATSGVGTSWYAYGSVFSEVIMGGLPSGSSVSASTESGATANPILVSQGDMPLGIGYNLVNHWAFDGLNLYEQKYDNLRGIAGNLDTFYYVGVVRKDAGWNDFKEVKEKQLPVKLSVLPSGMMGEVVTRMILEYYGITYDDIREWGGTVEFADWGTTVENIKDGRTDFVVHNVTQGHAALTELSATTALDFIQFPEEMIEYFATEEGFSKEVLPADSFKGQTNDLETFGLTSNLFCTEDLPFEVAYNIAKALTENVEKLHNGHTALSKFSKEGAGQPGGLGIPLHPGAEAYYKSAGLID